MVHVSFAFPFCGEEFRLTPSRALFWPRENTLLVADLHLEKASFYAQAGSLLPPYDSRETLERLARSLAQDGTTVLWVTHDPLQADRLGDRHLRLDQPPEAAQP